MNRRDFLKACASAAAAIALPLDIPLPFEGSSEPSAIGKGSAGSIEGLLAVMRTDSRTHGGKPITFEVSPHAYEAIRNYLTPAQVMTDLALHDMGYQNVILWGRPTIPAPSLHGFSYEVVGL